MQLFKFQQKMVREADELLGKLRLADENEQRSLTLVAACGAGKTITLAEIIRTSLPDSIVFVVTPGKGGLAEQTWRKLHDNLPDRVVTCVGEDTDLSRVTDGDVLVMNYEKGVVRHGANQKDGLGGQYKSRISRSGEMFNLWSMFAEARSNHSEVVMVVDEAHYGAYSSNGKSAISKFFDSITEAYGKPPLRIELTATPPDSAKTTTPTSKWYEADRSDAVAEGLVREKVMLNAVEADEINKAIQNAPDNDHEWAYMEVMYRRWDNLRKQVDFTPLMLFAISNGRGGDEERAKIERFLATKGLTIANGRVAVHLSESKENVIDNDLARNNSPVVALIFKTALALGWDCPRAQLLMLMRRVSDDNTVYTTQLLGRILRQPNAKSYGDPVLDRGYLYAPVDRHFQVPDSLSHEMTQVQDFESLEAKPELLQIFADLNVQSKRNKRGKQASPRALDGSGTFSLSLMPQVDLDAVKDQTVRALLNADLGAGESRSFNPNSDIILSEPLAKKAVLQQVMDTFADAQVRARARLSQGAMVVLRQWALQHADSGQEFLTLMSNANSLDKAIGNLARHAYQREQDESRDFFQDGDWTTWMPSEKRDATGELFDGYPTTVANTSLYGPRLRHTVSNSERHFEAEVLGRLNLRAWCRNTRQGGALANVFSFTYRLDNGSYRVSEPDYCVVVEANGEDHFIAFEVKGKDFTDASGDDSRFLKAVAAAEYTAMFDNLHAAAVYRKGSQWMVVTGVTRGGRLTERPLDAWLHTIGPDVTL